MRHQKAGNLLRLAELLASRPEGLTLDEMADELGVGRRTAERMRDAVAELFPLDEEPDPPTKRFRIRAGLGSFFNTPTVEELVALRRAEATFHAAGAEAWAATLAGLERKVFSAMKAAVRSRLDADVDELVQGEAVAPAPGPKPVENEAVLSAVRAAIQAGRRLRFRYEGGSNPGQAREMIPYGVLFGRTNYLLAADGAGGDPRTFRLDLVKDAEPAEAPGARPADFSLQSYADESVGIYRDQAEDVVLRFRPSAADGARRWRFHRGQKVESEADGHVRVSFRARGMRELALHLFTWGDGVEVVAPERLRTILVEELEKALAAHRPAT
jgi:predicted DNA-binding transcriptional regulator YafY